MGHVQVDAIKATALSGVGAWRRAAACGLAFRPIEDSDLPFLALVYASTRWEELAPLSWTEAEKTAFLQSQFEAQHAHYRMHYPTALLLVISRGNTPIGRLYLDRWKKEHRLVDIALLPAHRGRGYGTAMLQDLIDEAAGDGKALSIHVEKFNPAMRLYRRLGFQTVEDKGVYDLMSWIPSGQVNTAS